MKERKRKNKTGCEKNSEAQGILRKSKPDNVNGEKSRKNCTIREGKNDPQCAGGRGRWK